MKNTHVQLAESEAETAAAAASSLVVKCIEHSAAPHTAPNATHWAFSSSRCSNNMNEIRKA